MTSDKAYLYFKISLIGSVVLLSLTFFLTLAVFQNGKDLSVLAQFYTKPVGRSNQQVEAIPFKADDSVTSTRLNWNLIDEMLIRYYIETRFSTIADKYEMTRRWQKGSLFYLLSSSKVYNSFMTGGVKEKVGKVSRGVKTVDIINVRQDERNKNVYEVDFDVYTLMDSGELLPVEKQTAMMTLRHNLKRRLFKGSFANPYGAYVEKFEVAPRRN